MQKIIGLIKFALQFVFRPPAVTKKPVLLFNAFGGQYACNPKYILLKLHEKTPALKAYFLISDKHSSADPLPEYVLPVRRWSLKHIILYFRCNVYVINDVFAANADTVPFFNAYCKLLKKKLIICTWHGSGALKKCQTDIVGWDVPEKDVLVDFFLAGCRVTASLFSTFISPSKPFPVSLTGTPRSDILINGAADVAALKEKLGLPKDKKTLLFAPTFRSYYDNDNKYMHDVYESGVRQMEELDIPRLLDAMHERFGGEWALVFRAHHTVVVKMRKRLNEMPAVLNGNLSDDMMEYLACADVLLTDYSSSMIDFALTRRPCFLFALDREHYENEERGFYSDFDALPFPFAESFDALIANIRGFDEAAYIKGVDAMFDELGCVEDGRASERLADCILHYISTGEKRLETVEGVDGRQ